MPKKIGKKERKSQNRLPEPRTFFIASEGIKIVFSKRISRS